MVAGNNIWVDDVTIVIVLRCSTSSYYTFPPKLNITLSSIENNMGDNFSSL